MLNPLKRDFCARDNQHFLLNILLLTLLPLYFSGVSFGSSATVLNLEEANGYVAGDELLEITPAAVWIRKEVLDPVQRKVLAKKVANRQ